LKDFLTGTSSIVLILIMLVMLALPGACTLEYTIEYWCSLSQQKAVDVGFGKCLVGGFFFSEVSIPGALVTWIIDKSGIDYKN